jgi:hypothetical protein
MPGKKGDKGQPGQKGERGEKGDKGERGEPGPASAVIVEWEIDEANYRATAILSTGEVAGVLDLRSMFERYHSERS